MTRLTMHAQGGLPPQSAPFAPPHQQPAPRRVPVWMLAGVGALFLAMFTALVVTTTLLVVQSRDARALQASMELDEPAAPVMAEASAPAEVVPEVAADAEVTRTSVDLLSADLPSPEPARVEPAVPLRQRIQTPSCIDYLDTLVKITHVRFPLGSNEPAAADMPRVRNMATALRLCPEVKVIVEGHSDQRGSDKLNMDLSWYRAETVMQILKDEGFETAQMVPLGFGARRPINLSGTISGEGENRRVQFQLVPRDTVVDERLARN